MPTADSTADRPVGMTYLLGDWATDCWAIAVDRQPGDRRLNQTCLIFQRRLVARRRPPTSAADSVAQGHADSVGMGLKAGRILDHRKSTLAKGSRWDYTPLPF